MLLDHFRFVAHFVLEQVREVLISAIVTLSDLIRDFATLANDIGRFLRGDCGGSTHCGGHHVVIWS